MRTPASAPQSALKARWWAAAGLFGLAAGLMFGWLWLSWTPLHALRWSLLAAAVLSYLLWLLRRSLPHNRRHADAPLLPTFGAGTWLTLWRGLGIGLLAGFLLCERPTAGLLAWTPALLYTLVSVLDYLDGYVARRTNHETGLGQMLDGVCDALGLLLAVALAVSYGQLPAWYLLIGLARYLFGWGLWWRARRGRPTFDLPPSDNRRLLAGIQMGFITVILWPLFAPPATTLAAALFAVPFLLGFGRDWLVVSGRLAATSPAYQRARRIFLQATTRWLPLPLRAGAVVIAAGWLVSTPGAAGLLWPDLALLGAASTLLLALGVLGRLAALGLLAASALSTPAMGLTWANGALLAAAIILLQTGAGAWSLWQPEETALRRRAGKRAAAAG